MSAQSTPQTPIEGIVSIAASSPNRTTRALLERLLLDIIKLRNSVDALTTQFNAHTHFDGSGITSKPDSSDPGQSPLTASVATGPVTIGVTY